MAGLVVGIGLLGYVVAGFILLISPTITQEIAGFLVATNATLFCVGGMIVMAIEGKREAALRSPTPAARAATGAKDDYSQWADRLTTGSN